MLDRHFIQHGCGTTLLYTALNWNFNERPKLFSLPLKFYKTWGKIAIVVNYGIREIGWLQATQPSACLNYRKRNIFSNLWKMEVHSIQ